MSIRHRLSAYRDLLSRYAAAFSHAWGRRAALGTGFFNGDEAQFLPSALALQEQPVSPTARWTARALACMTLLTLSWSIVGRVDIIVNARGKVIPTGRVKTVASVEVASVRAIHVAEGQRIKAGDVLVELDASGSDAEGEKAAVDLATAAVQAARSRAMLAALGDGRPPRLPARAAFEAAEQIRIGDQQWRDEQTHVEGLYRDYLAKLRRLDGEIARCERALPLVAQRASDLAALLVERDVPRHEWSQQEQARVELQGLLASSRNQRAALIAETRRVALDQLSEAAKIMASARQDAIRSASHSKLMKLTASVDGTVQQLTVHTVGGVVPAAQPLMQIVPAEGAVEIEARLENKDVGFVHEGQPAAAKVEAFDYSKYGTIPAVVAQVSRDAIDDEKQGPVYAARVRPVASTLMVDGSPRPITPGMAVDVEIKTGERRLIEYLLSPLMRHHHEALHER